MFLAWAYFSLLLLPSVALRNDRQLRHRLETSFGHKPAIRRSLDDAALTVEVTQAVLVFFRSLADPDDVFVPRQLKIDHFGNGQGTFRNRYWINDSYYDGGPVFGARWTVPAGPFVDLSSAQSSMWGKPMPRITTTRFFRQVLRVMHPDDSLSFTQEARGVNSSVMALARNYKGLGILWEHRYYGLSIPFLDQFSNVVRPSSRPPPEAI